MDAVAFGTQIKRVREARGLTQEALAQLIGISRNQVQNIEGGLSDRAKGTPANPRLSTVLRLCGALDVNVRIDVSRPDHLRVIVEDIG